MSFRLEPKNPALDAWMLPNGEWLTIMERGPGLVLGSAPGIRPDTSLHSGKNAPTHNDGARVGPRTARLFGRLVLKLLKIERVRQSIWKEKNYEAMREALERAGGLLPLPDNWLDRWEEFAAWCKASAGFAVC